MQIYVGFLFAFVLINFVFVLIKFGCEFVRRVFFYFKFLLVPFKKYFYLFVIGAVE